MKRLLVFLLVGTLLFSLVGCAKEPNDSSANTTSTVEDVSSVESTDVSTPESKAEVSSVVSKAEPTQNSFIINGLSEQITNEIKTYSAQLQPWGQGTKKDEFNRPVYAVSIQEKYEKLGGRYIMENSKKIYLTFDEGYEVGYTGSILDTLKEKNVKAVFFITLNYAKKNQKLVRRMIDEGHIVGHHSSAHFSYPTKSLQEVYDDFVGLHKYVKEKYNYEMKVFRFPSGQYSEQTLALVKALGYESVFWSFAYHDWDTEDQPDPEEAFNKFIKDAHPGAIYLIHAVSKTNTEILGRVIDEFRADGYELAKYPV